jgi:hypothetical protein
MRGFLGQRQRRSKKLADWAGLLRVRRGVFRRADRQTGGDGFALVVVGEYAESIDQQEKDR